MTEHSTTTVKEVMTPAPRVIDGLATVREAIDLMRARNVSALVIDRRHEGDEFGIVSVHDIACDVIGKNRAPDRVSVYEIMSKPVLTVDVDMDVKYAIRILARYRLERTLVTDKREMAGIVTLRDMVFRYMTED